MEMELPLEKIAIAGKCVTENIGIEKIIKNVISNPKLKYMILCGKVSNGHFVGQAIKSLVDNGVDGDRRIIGAKGGMPVLKNIGLDEIEKFRMQIIPVDMAGEEDVSRIETKIDEILSGALEKTEHMEAAAGATVPLPRPEDEFPQATQETDAVSPGGWERDPKGFFTISLDNSSKEIVAKFHGNDGSLLKILKGNETQALYKKIIELGLISNLQHAAYIGSELAKAEIALKAGADYEEDTGLDIGQRLIKLKETVKTGDTYEREYAYLKAGKFVALPTKDHEEKVKIGEDEISFREFLKSKGLSRIF